MCNLSENIYEKGIEKGRELGIELGKEIMLCQIIHSKIRNNASNDDIYNEFKEFGVSIDLIKKIRTKMNHSA